VAFPEPLERLIHALEKFPGVGARSAERMALHVLRTQPEEVADLAMALRDARMETCRCEICRNIALQSPCPICADESRDVTVVCVVEGPREVEKLESSGAHMGLYHVLLEGFAPRRAERLFTIADNIDQMIDLHPFDKDHALIMATMQI